MTQPRRSPYAGRRPATASVPRADEERFVKRYWQTANLARCLREFGLGERRGRTILERNGVEFQARQRMPADEQAVLRAFGRLGSVTAVAVLQAIGESEVRAILDSHIVTHDARIPVPDFGKTYYQECWARFRREL